MQSNVKINNKTADIHLMSIEDKMLLTSHDIISQSWQIIAPSWPLQHLIAVNPLQGLESLPFEQALIEGFSYFEDANLSKNMGEINRETIKWCQAFFDEGQATISMPYRHLGLYQAFKKLAPFDEKLRCSNVKNDIWLVNLPERAEDVIAECLTKLMIPLEHRIIFLSLILTMLPGWAGYIKYRTEWAQNNNLDNPVSQADYLAVRLVLTTILWPQAVELIKSHRQFSKDFIFKKIKSLHEQEMAYQKPLLEALSCQALKMCVENKDEYEKPIAQMVFCIDVRSEPFRRAIETQGHYETFGFAGFFGIPVRIENEVLSESKVSCPVLMKPKHTVKKVLKCSADASQKIIRRINLINKAKSIYQALKYNFTTPLILVEMMGMISGVSMLLRAIIPNKTVKIKQNVIEQGQLMSFFQSSLLDDTKSLGIPYQDQCVYAENALRTMGLTKHFSDLIVLCGHGSVAENNAYSTALDCGACGGNHGGNNAKILSVILNDIDVRHYLIESGINIPDDTIFIAAEHNTTTDEVSLYINQPLDENMIKKIDQLKCDLEKARINTNQYRCKQFGYSKNKNYSSHLKTRSNDWAQTRPEWGLARNAAFIIGPRQLTQFINLDGRVFLHSYNWQEDEEGELLTTILTAPMIVAQWINSQYLFSSLDNVAYGSGSKITHNITGKMGVMQGNSSDLMHGLPLQSLYSSDIKPYHEPLRLITIVYAPRASIDKIISAQPILQKLFGNGWISLACIEPEENNIYHLQRNLMWHKNQ